MLTPGWAPPPAPSARPSLGRLCGSSPARSTAGRSIRPDVGSSEVVALEQQRLAGRLGQRVGKAVTEIQSGRMIAAAVVDVGLAGDADLLFGHRSMPIPARSTNASSRLALRPAWLSMTIPASRRLAAKIRRTESRRIARVNRPASGSLRVWQRAPSCRRPSARQSALVVEELLETSVVATRIGGAPLRDLH